MSKWTMLRWQLHTVYDSWQHPCHTVVSIHERVSNLSAAISAGSGILFAVLGSSPTPLFRFKVICMFSGLFHNQHPSATFSAHHLNEV
jgi:hypothetical protein